MPVTVSGMASGINTHELIEKLVDLEKAPIERLKQNETTIKAETEALEELRRKTKKLQEKLKVLSGFEASFEHKKVEISPEGYLEATATKKAGIGNHKIQILSVASSLSFASKNLPRDYVVNSGKIMFNDKSAEFKGGSLNDFRDFLNRHFKDEISAKIVQIEENANNLIIEGKKTGKEGKLKIQDPSGILANLGMYQSPKTPQREERIQDTKPEKENKLNFMLWEKENLKGKDGSFHISPDKKSLFLKAESQVEVRLPLDDISSWKKILIQTKTADEINPIKIDNPKKNSIEDGPVETINIRGIELSTYTIPRERIESTEKKNPVATDYGVFLVFAEGEEKVSLVNKTEISLEDKKSLKGIRLYSHGKEVEFRDFAIDKEYKGNKNEGKKADPQENEEFPHLLREPQNAKIKIGDVVIERSHNNDIKDVIEGVSFNLLKAAPGEEIEIRIAPNQEKAFEQIKSFVEAYNELISYAQDTSRTAQVNDVGKFKEMKQKQGILVTNASVRSLIQGLKMHVSNAYPSQKEPAFRILADIGITTGEIGAKWEDISQGLLQIDEQKLKELLENHPLSVKELFVSDTNLDNKPDHGFAYTTEKFLEPYTRLTGGIISTQIKNNQEKLKQIARDIQKVEDHAKDYEAKLKQKFGYMEANIAKQKATGKFLSDRLNQNKKED